MENRYRANFINSVTGYKSANLIGTISSDGIENLAVFSSVTHLGSNPSLIGFITRPTTVPRHTYKNIHQTKEFTVNHIHTDIIKNAHQTAARYDEHISEFDAVGLDANYIDSCKAPFVAQAHIKIACKFVNEYAIKENGTVLIVGAINEVFLPESALENDGWINLEATKGVTINGLDSYSKPQLLDRLSYAKPDHPITSIRNK